MLALERFAWLIQIFQLRSGFEDCSAAVTVTSVKARLLWIDVSDCQAHAVESDWYSCCAM